MRILVLALLCLPLAGCFGLTWPPPPLPDWAMQPQANAVTPVHGRVADRMPSRRAHKAGDTSPTRSKTKPDDDILPFTPEWQAREDAFDAQLRRSMNICRGC